MVKSKGESIDENTLKEREATLINERMLCWIKHNRFKLLIWTILSIGTFFELFPFFWIVSTSLKIRSQILRFPPQWIPDPIVLKNFVEAFNTIPIARFLYNSLVVSISITFAQILTGVLAAYAFARINFYGRDILFILFLSTMMIPGHALIIPHFLLIQKFGMIDTYEGLILPKVAHAFGIFLLRQFFMTIPHDLEDAAKLDGCSRLRVLFNVILPLSVPAIMALIILTFMQGWNDLLWPLIVTQTDRVRTITVGLGHFVESQGHRIEYGPMMAASLIAILPTLIVYLFAQKHFVRGIMLTGLK